MTGTDGNIGEGSVEVILKADGKEIYSSGVIRQGDAPKQIDVSLKDIRMLEMVVDPTADGASGDQVLLVSPVIGYQGKMPEMMDVQSVGEGPRQSETVIARLEQQIGKLPVWESRLSDRTPFDWLLTPEKSEAGIYRSPDGKSIVIANGMVARTFRIFPNLATTHLTNRMTGESMIRAVSGEGFYRLTERSGVSVVWQDNPKELI